MRAAFKASADADVAALLAGLEQYRVTQERLEMQKKLLLHQASTRRGTPHQRQPGFFSTLLCSVALASSCTCTFLLATVGAGIAGAAHATACFPARTRACVRACVHTHMTCVAACWLAGPRC